MKLKHIDSNLEVNYLLHIKKKLYFILNRYLKYSIMYVFKCELFKYRVTVKYLVILGPFDLLKMPVKSLTESQYM